MDDNTITEYGWVVIVVLVIAAALVLVPGLNRIIEDTTKEQINEPFEDAGETVTNYTRYDVDNSNGLLVAILMWLQDFLMITKVLLLQKTEQVAVVLWERFRQVTAQNL